MNPDTKPGIPKNVKPGIPNKKGRPDRDAHTKNTTTKAINNIYWIRNPLATVCPFISYCR